MLGPQTKRWAGLAEEGLRIGKVNERGLKGRVSEDKRGIQIKAGMEKMEVSRCLAYLKAREREDSMKTRGRKEGKDDERERERGQRSGAEARQRDKCTI